MLISQWREYFSLIILLREKGKITRPRLVLRSPSNSSFNREVFFFCNNGVSCPDNIINEEYIEESKDKSENENTKNNTEWWKKVFKKWASINDCRSFS